MLDWAKGISRLQTVKFANVYGHYRIAYLIDDETRVVALGVFHGSMDIERHLT